MIESKLKIYLGLANAGVPVRRIILLRFLRKGTRVYDLLESNVLR
jgi:hypothetical protein